MSEAGRAGGACDQGATILADVAIIGAGLAGTSTAIVLAEAGYRVALIDAQAVYPSEFRGEKLDLDHMAVLDRLGLGSVVRPLVTPMEKSRIYRYGRLVSKTHLREYGFSYGSLINGLRAALPPMATFVRGRVAGLTTGPDRQRVELTDGTVTEARLVVLATGLGDAVRRHAGLRRIETSRGHSLSLGFNMALPRPEFSFDTLTYYGFRPVDRMAYLTLFPIDGAMRGNLFVYRTAGDPWTRAFRQDPQPILRELAPDIAELCGDFRIAGSVDIRQIDLTITEDPRRDGIVLIGDAFCTTCPAPGVGFRRVVTDVERLCSVHLPRWFETPGMGADKIARFYNDRVKRRVDGASIASSFYARGIVTGTGLLWDARRVRNAVVRQTLSRLAHSFQPDRQPGRS
ncbi:FAD-dependent oxidoreductase [Methylobacterium planeticum]|uniref:FAD-dependent monooxygenase n=1 Tax=Methylobacterium planeticum TaxID=2615211 RepID=A0A6N6MPU5_9HYPH|nr:NAD(P)/FAD-dependent oxidoreductase [Methylobacterium planeticum]KAB1072574.1 FAD-dependent monooxygenase [Methylobacterium planeticum]